MYVRTEYLSMLLNLEYSLKCDAFIGTLASNWCRLVDEMRATVGTYVHICVCICCCVCSCMCINISVFTRVYVYEYVYICIRASVIYMIASFLVHHILIFNSNILLSIFDIFRTNSSLLITSITSKYRMLPLGTGAQKPYIDLSTETCGKEMCINEGVKDFQW